MRFTSAFALSALTVLVSASTLTKSSCEKADDADCKDFCATREQTSTCLASGDKITCYCSGGKAPESNCEERCLFCVPDKAALDQVNRLLVGGPKMDEL
ncbi:hypothetical protein N0V93_001809 [Gnomoniopsis smithogilvyi]|uniref:Uncharacterized protein n=1 Tax=Gnomoniopsis smithogilvyi TaxID=1191159 RepID=A0A9W9D1K0_9PEZI|nr:hypothetical protein N0V93_001809 [Gnomoniopsis smithogilvyi]